jgi:single stranded DNA-binding protein
MVNKTLLKGRIAKVERRSSSNGKVYARLVVAIRRSYRTDTGEWRETTSFIPTKVIYQNLLQKLAYVQVGDEVLIEGHLEQFWSNSQNPTSIVEVLVERIEVTKKKSQQPAQPQPAQPEQQPAQQPEQPAQTETQQQEQKPKNKKKRKISEVEEII